MLQLTAIAKGQARAVQTKYGDRLVLDAIGEDGNEYTIWRPGHDGQLPKVANGERITLGVDSKGKTHLLETLADRVTHPGSQLPGMRPLQETAAPDYNAHNGRSAEIADYVERLGKLYKYCYTQAKETLAGEPALLDDHRAVATTLFIQAVRHFDL